MSQLPSQLQQYVHLSRYARWIEEENRRETWSETVQRYCEFFENKFPDHFPADRLFKAIRDLQVMPSMRALMTAGPALERDNIAGYNCSYAEADNVRIFDEILYVLMCGTGAGFSVERQYINKLPIIGATVIDGEIHTASSLINVEDVITVADSKTGWATAYKELIAHLYKGKVPKWDTSLIRPAGAKLKIFGGRASGPAPLIDLFEFTVEVFRKAVGRKLNSIECHDIICKIADVVVVGGVRRSALISLSNLTDLRIRGAKTGQLWWETNPQRQLANNSVAYTEKPDMEIFMSEWMALMQSGTGERGLFNRVAATSKALENGRRDGSYDFGTNPCGEIILRSNGLCNLSEVVVRTTDTLEELLNKVELATIIGTFQSTLTDFRYVRKVWRDNAEAERLLGVSLTGIMDHPVLSGVEGNKKLASWLEAMKVHAVTINKQWAERLGINPAAAITTVKPSGTVSQLVDSASGIHPRYAQYYVRTVRADKKDPLAIMMAERGFPVEDDVTKPDAVSVFSFPVKAPTHAVFRDQMTAVQQLEHYQVFKDSWCEHNPSITVYVRNHEWLEVGAWVYKNFDGLGGVSFLPHSDHQYKQAPYQEVTRAMYNELRSKMPEAFDWAVELANYEVSDNLVNTKELACSAGVCDML